MRNWLAYFLLSKHEGSQSAVTSNTFAITQVAVAALTVTDAAKIPLDHCSLPS